MLIWLILLAELFDLKICQQIECDESNESTLDKLENAVLTTFVF
jgi:hypothetical protein